MIASFCPGAFYHVHVVRTFCSYTLYNRESSVTHYLSRGGAEPTDDVPLHGPWHTIGIPINFTRDMVGRHVLSRTVATLELKVAKA